MSLFRLPQDISAHLSYISHALSSFFFLGLVSHKYGLFVGHSNIARLDYTFNVSIPEIVSRDIITTSPKIVIGICKWDMPKHHLPGGVPMSCGLHLYDKSVWTSGKRFASMTASGASASITSCESRGLLRSLSRRLKSSMSSKKGSQASSSKSNYGGYSADEESDADKKMSISPVVGKDEVRKVREVYESAGVLESWGGGLFKRLFSFNRTKTTDEGAGNTTSHSPFTSALQASEELSKEVESRSHL